MCTCMPCATSHFVTSSAEARGYRAGGAETRRTRRDPPRGMIRKRSGLWRLEDLWFKQGSIWFDNFDMIQYDSIWFDLIRSIIITVPQPSFYDAFWCFLMLRAFSDVFPGVQPLAHAGRRGEGFAFSWIQLDSAGQEPQRRRSKPVVHLPRSATSAACMTTWQHEKMYGGLLKGATCTEPVQCL